jgi:phytoene dehydrogenase-like protein
MNGYQTRIFEMHTLPGGLCTAWQRQGFIFDGCIHYLFGSGQGQPLHTKNAGFPVGGSLKFAQAIAHRYLTLGGEIHYGSQVERVSIENHRAIGIRLIRILRKLI